MKALLLAGVTALALTASAEAAQIVVFGQTSQNNTVTATTNGAQTQTTISVTDATVDLTQFINGPLNGLDLNLTATSIDAAQTIGGAVLQHYAGNFCITTQPGCAGTNILSGTFSDAAFGGAGGPGLVINTNNPPDVLTLTSDVVLPADLAAPNTLNFSLSNLVPLLSIAGTTIAAFDASLGGNVSATHVAEPGTLLLLGMGLMGLGMVRRKRA